MLLKGIGLINSIKYLSFKNPNLFISTTTTKNYLDSNPFKTFIHRKEEKKEDCEMDNDVIKEDYGYQSLKDLNYYIHGELLENTCLKLKLNLNDWEFEEEWEEVNSVEDDEDLFFNEKSNKKSRKKNKKDKDANDFFDFLFNNNKKESKKSKKTNNTNFNNKNEGNRNGTPSNPKFSGLSEDIFRKFIEDNTDETNSRRFICKICKGFKNKLEYTKIKDHFIDKHEKEYNASKYFEKGKIYCIYFIIIF
jgi:hypothetical protein